jgi:hypothetical protein
MDARAESSARPKTSGYPAVQDRPAKREKPPMTADERLKLQKELIAAAIAGCLSVKPEGRCARRTNKALTPSALCESKTILRRSESSAKVRYIPWPPCQWRHRGSIRTRRPAPGSSPGVCMSFKCCNIGYGPKT